MATPNPTPIVAPQHIIETPFVEEEFDDLSDDEAYELEMMLSRDHDDAAYWI